MTVEERVHPMKREKMNQMDIKLFSELDELNDLEKKLNELLVLWFKKISINISKDFAFNKLNNKWLRYENHIKVEMMNDGSLSVKICRWTLTEIVEVIREKFKEKIK